MENTRNELKPHCSKVIEDIIMNYTYPKCIECKKLVELTDTIFTTDDDYLCKECEENGGYNKCSSCSKMYKILTNIFCSSCNNNCVVFCRHCLNSQYRRDLRTTGEDTINDIMLFLNLP